MIPAQFGYTRAASIDDALKALAAGGGTKVIAGGQSLLPLMKLRLASVETLVDIGRLGELRGVEKLDDGRLSVGALTTYTELADSPAIHYGVLRDALPTIGDVQVRNRGTVGGAIAHADPASDFAAVALALDADLVLQSASGTRTVKADGFFTGPFTSAMAADELLTRIVLPAPLDNAGSAYASLEQPASGYPMVGVGAVVIFGAGDVIEWAGIGVTGVGDHPYRASEAEAALSGTTGSDADISAASAAVVGGRTVNADIHASAEYRTAMAGVIAGRAIRAALARLR
jgi:aerobic carbon-monoxide dehydrogenase medium subunit